MPSAQLASIRPSPGYYGKPALRNASVNISMRSGVVMFPDARPFTVKLGRQRCETLSYVVRIDHPHTIRYRFDAENRHRITRDLIGLLSDGP
jgi:hypothetical protein